MTERNLLLAVDGGGTKTLAVVADLEGHVLGRGLGPGSNPYAVGFLQFSEAVTGAVQAALRPVLGPQKDGFGHNGRIAAACFGMAGVDGPEDEAAVTAWVRQQEVAPSFLVVNDVELILAGGTPEGWGVALISGTGSNCLGRARDGRTARVGGWGTLLGDEGSGYHIGLEALRLAARAYDGRGEAKALLDAALRQWSLRDIPALMRLVHAPTTTPADIAVLAPMVFELAAQGDVHARGILERAVDDLADHVRTAMRQLGLQHPPLALGGGLFSGTLREALASRLASEVGPVSYVADPVLGAVTIARRLASSPRP
jgi:N-acetylglucosamine kinase-like BadF-type ATPase